MGVSSDLREKMKMQVKMLSQNVYLPAVYNLHRFSRTRKNLVLFADAHHTKRPEAMDLLYRYLRKDGKFDIRQMYLDFGTAPRPEVLAFSTRFMRLYAEAAVVVICDNFLPAASCRKKPGTLVVQLWHACGCYKKFGYDAKDDIPEGYHGDVYRNTDLVTVSAQAAVGPFSSAMKRTHGEVQPVGVSRTDLYYSLKWRQYCRKKVQELCPDNSENPSKKGNQRKLVLWAPTFRGSAGDPGLLSLDVKKLQRELGDGYLVLTKLHPHMKTEQKESCSDCPLPTEQLYPSVDVLIADYSSLIYEYLLVSQLCAEEEPYASGRRGQRKGKGGLVLYVPDLDRYESQRGFYMNIREIPGEVVTREKDLADAVRRAVEGGNPNTEDFLRRYMSACDGHATRRIAGRIRKHCGLCEADSSKRSFRG